MWIRNHEVLRSSCGGNASYFSGERARSRPREIDFAASLLGGNPILLYKNTTVSQSVYVCERRIFESRLLVTQMLAGVNHVTCGFSYRRQECSSISSTHVFRCDQAAWLKLTSSCDEPNHRFVVETKQKRKYRWMREEVS